MGVKRPEYYFVVRPVLVTITNQYSLRAVTSTASVATSSGYFFISVEWGSVAGAKT